MADDFNTKDESKQDGKKWSFRDIFRTDSLFSDIMTLVFNLMLLNILWLLCCIPVITIGASTTALYYMMFKILDGEDYSIIKGFLRSLRENFRESVPMTLLLVGLSALLVFNLHYFGTISHTGFSGVGYGVCLVVLVLMISEFSYAFPLLSYFENTVKGTLTNAYKMAATHLGTTLLVLLINCVPWMLFLFFPTMFYRLFVIWLVIGTAVSAFVDAILLRRIFWEFE